MPAKTIAAGLEPATVGSEVQRSSIEPRDRRKIVPPAGLEPATFGLEVQRAIHCAKGANVQATPTRGGPKSTGSRDRTGDLTRVGRAS